jgi:hypothetical protein
MQSEHLFHLAEPPVEKEVGMTVNNPFARSRR